MLERAGYTVHASGTSIQLLNKLLIEAPADAIAISEDVNECNVEAVVTSRSLSSAPIILFEGVNRKSDPPAVDLLISNLTSPEQWLKQIETVVQESKRIRDEAKASRQLSSELRQQAISVRTNAAKARQRAADEHSRAQLNLRHNEPNASD